VKAQIKQQDGAKPEKIHATDGFLVQFDQLGFLCEDESVGISHNLSPDLFH
jgi:hypothetical protein